MYKIPSRANNIAVKTRRSFQIDVQSHQLRFEDSSGSHSSNAESPERLLMPSSAVVFKKSHNINNNSLNSQHHHNSSTNQSNNHSSKLKRHDLDMIKFVQSGWNQVMQEYQKSQKQGNSKVVFYEPQQSNDALHDFKPIDLEKWFVQRMLKNMDLDPSITA